MNDNDPKVCAWLRELVRTGELAGEVCERDIHELTAADCQAEQCHFFAGIGGWPLALRMAGWGDRPIWTGSCPCQPFSAAGKRKGTADERHLWPSWFRLIRERHPQYVAGEQVTGAIGHGWLDGVFADLEAQDYTCGAVVLGAHSVGAPHIRQRIYWVAYAGVAGAGRHTRAAPSEKTEMRRAGYPDGMLDGIAPGNSRETCGVAHTECTQRRADIQHDPVSNGRQQETGGPRRGCDTGGLADAESRIGQVSICQQGPRRAGSKSRGSGGTDGLGDADESGPQGRRLSQSGRAGELPAGPAGCWADSRTIECRDGKRRRIPFEPAFFPLAHRVPGRVGLLRGYGNAIVPQVAAAFLRAFLDIHEGQLT